MGYIGWLWAFGVVIFGWWVYEKKCKKIRKNDKKKPRNWPIVGSQVQAFWNYDRLHDWCHSFFSDQNRTVEFKFFSTRFYMTVDPANVEHILKSNFRNYPKGEKTRYLLKDLLGDGIFNADGKTWKKQHNIAHAVFCGKSVKDLSLLSFRKDSLRLLATIEDATTFGHTINLQDVLMGMTMDSICRVGFGISEGDLSMMRSTFTRAFDKANAMIITRFVNVWWKVYKFLNLGSEKTLMHELANLNAFTSQVIAQKRSELSKASIIESNIQVKVDLLSRLMDIGGEASSEKGARDFILNFIVAGRDTTAVTMSWFIYNMCKKKEVAEKVYKEVREIIHRNNLLKYETDSLKKFQVVANCLTFEALSEMHYLHAALTETLRLYPAVPRDTKVAIQDDVLPDGTTIRAGDHVAYVPYSMGRMKFLWGDDAHEFKPERWLENDQFVQASPFEFTAFQAGPRMCLGKDWAYLQMKMAMALLMYFFEFRLVPHHIVRYKMMMVLAMANGLQVTVQNRLIH